MLRQQSPQYGPMDFLAGDGEMARRIRETDWSDHPFGPIEQWPQSLRLALSICLNSAFPTAIYWGPELRLLYNDAWAPIPGPRHPEALGAPARRVWSDIWDVIEPQFNEVIRSGTGLFAEDQMLPMQRYGRVEETYWNYSFTPLRGEKGNIVGVWNSGSETTQNVIQRRNAEFVVRLNEGLRGCASAEAGMTLALERLGTHLGADVVGVVEPGSDGALGVTRTIYPPQSEAISPPRDSWIGPRAESELRAGRDAYVDREDTALEPETRRYLEERNLSNGVLVPWTSAGRLEAALFIHWSQPRVTSVLDVALIEKVVETTMSWAELDRARAREMVMAREIDHRARNLLAILRGLARLISADTVPGYKEKLDDRITALSRIHSLLSDRRWEGLGLGEVLHEELGTFDVCESVRVEVEGPDVTLAAADAQLIAMMFHELSTNSVKYGALGHSAGALQVRWSLGRDDGPLDLSWTERSPSIHETDREVREGFGTILLRRIVQDHFQGKIAWERSAGSLRYDISLPAGLWQVSPHMPTAPMAERSGARRRSVMIVEDEPIIALDLAGMMEAAGYEVFGQFGTIASAREGMARGVPDVALVDENLAGESSREIVQALVGRGVGVAIISGYEGEPMTGVPRLSKPVSEAELLATVRNLLGG